jgi:hypothetical protein
MEKLLQYTYFLFMLQNHAPKMLYCQVFVNISSVKQFLLSLCMTWPIGNQQVIRFV